MPLSSEEQALLEEAGRALARGTDRYGATQVDSKASLVQVRRIDSATARVLVLDAVGLVATPTVQLNVRPKIPVPHLLEILQAADVVPRFATGEGLMKESQSLVILVAHWFVTALEKVLEEGLARDYRSHRDELTAVRGRVLPLPTARLFYRGRVAIVADYEEFDFDTPLNRMMLNVARILAGATPLPGSIRRRALRAAKRMDGVGWLRSSDAAVEIDRRTHYYTDALKLARQIVAATGRSLDAGSRRSWTFLFRTPIPVEVGIRAIITDALGDLVSVRKGRLPLTGANLTINPDLVLEDTEVRAIGDVKYKLLGAEWERPDLYEAAAFAAGYRVPQAVVALFAEPGTHPLPAVQIGDHLVRQVYWPADSSLSAEAARQQFAKQLRDWYLHQAAPAAVRQIVCLRQSSVGP